MTCGPRALSVVYFVVQQIVLLIHHSSYHTSNDLKSSSPPPRSACPTPSSLPLRIRAASIAAISYPSPPMTRSPPNPPQGRKPATRPLASRSISRQITVASPPSRSRCIARFDTATSRCPSSAAAPSPPGRSIPVDHDHAARRSPIAARRSSTSRLIPKYVRSAHPFFQYSCCRLASLDQPYTIHRHHQSPHCCQIRFFAIDLRRSSTPTPPLTSLFRY